MLEIVKLIREAGTVRMFGLAISLIAVAALLVWWLVFSSPLVGVAYVSVLDAEGGVQTAAVRLEDAASTMLPAPGERLTALAVVPSHDRSATAYLVWDMDSKVRRILITSSLGTREATVTGATIDTLSWAVDGKTIAFSLIGTTTDLAYDPDQWEVGRAVLNGDALSVGSGYRPYATADGRILALGKDGVLLLSGSETKELALASAAPVNITTPFTVSHDGTRVAWVNPADQSLQVFEQINERYVPLLLQKEVSPQSMAFSPDGAYILGAFPGESTTTLAVIAIDGGARWGVGEIPGLVTVHTWLYEE